jgi:hypothetical protein
LYAQPFGTLSDDGCSVTGSGTGGYGFGGSYGSGGTGGPFLGNGPTTGSLNPPSTGIFQTQCESCAQSCLDAIIDELKPSILDDPLGWLWDKAVDLFELTPLAGALDCISSIIYGDSLLGAAGDCFGHLVPGLDLLCKAIKLGSACLCVDDASPDFCGNDAPTVNPFDDGDIWQLPLGHSERVAVQQFADATNRLWRMFRPRLYEFGNPEFLLSVSMEDRDILGGVIDQIAASIDPGSVDGERVSEAEAALLLALPKPTGWPGDLTPYFVERWNRTQDYAALGWLNASDVPEGYSVDFIEAGRLTAFLDDASIARGEQLAAGYVDPFREIPDALKLMSLDATGGQGSCVKLTIQLDQTVTLVRQAFAATLAITNGTDAAIEAIDVDVIIRDADGNDAAERFAVLGPAVTGVSDVSGNGTLGIDAVGSATWTIVPGDSAAPSGPTTYFVSGTLGYAIGGQVVAIPLFPVQITVLPNASLSMQYFLETQVYGDDPFTAETEPAVPFSLGLWAKNNGGGTAENVVITSAQPQIIENETDAAIGFEIIGSQVNEAPVTPSLTVGLGDILPGEVSVAQWLFVSTIQGRFVGYSATIESTNGFDDPEFAIVDEAAVNEMIHVVRADVPLDDGRPDFLGNLEPNIFNLPDRVYLSNGAIEPVSSVTDATVTATAQQKRRVTTDAAEGWRYIRIDDPFAGAVPLVDARRSDGKILRAKDNAWQTSFIDRSTPQPIARRYVHLFDRGGDGVYDLTFSFDGLKPRVDTWAVVASHGGIATPVANYVSPQVPWSEPRGGGIAALTLSFSEPVDPSTAIAANVLVTGVRPDGSDVSLAGITKSVLLRLGNQYADITFTPPLPEGARYCIRLVQVKDAAGNPLEAAGSRIDVSSVLGDVTNDLRVTADDISALNALVGESAINASNPFQVRSDLDRDGAITTTDLAILIGSIGLDVGGTEKPCGSGSEVVVAGDPGDGAGSTDEPPAAVEKSGQGGVLVSNPGSGPSVGAPPSAADGAAPVGAALVLDTFLGRGDPQSGHSLLHYSAKAFLALPRESGGDVREADRGGRLATDSSPSPPLSPPATSPPLSRGRAAFQAHCLLSGAASIVQKAELPP